MANTFHKECVDGGDLGVWGLKELRQNRPSLGINTCRLYDNGGTLEMTTGIIGIDYGSNRGVTLFDTITTPISIAAIANSRWFYIELSIAGSTPSIVVTDTGDSSYWKLPAVFTGAYDRAKAGYYINTSKRCIGMGWKNSAGVLKGVINVGSIDDHYIGYSTCPTTGFVYTLKKNIDTIFDSKYSGIPYDLPYAQRTDTLLVNTSTNTGGTWSAAVQASTSVIPYGAKAMYCCIEIFGVATNLLCVEKASGETLDNIAAGTNFAKYARVRSDGMAAHNLGGGAMVWIPLDINRQFKWCTYTTNSTVYISAPVAFRI